MTDILLIILIILAVLIVFLQFLTIFRIKSKGSARTESSGEYAYENLKNIVGMTAKNLSDNIGRSSEIQRERLDKLNEGMENQNRRTEYRINEMKDKIELSLKAMREENARQLDLMRQTVDEKLSTTLENRLNKSFELVSSRLEAVAKGIGEMHQIAENVSDIKRVFSNVKLRGTWGELQLESLLSQMLAPGQYIKNCKLDNKNGNEIVDFAIVMPSKDFNTLLPVDSKFPMEEFTRYLTAHEEYNKENILKAQKNLERVIKLQADSIYKKYIVPPLTTDFAIMYFPVESLYAEALKIDGLVENLTEKRIMMCGPANLAALLTTLQTGFKTMAIEKRSSELWQLLSAFKHEFSRFSTLLTLTQKKLQEAQDTIDDAAKKTRKIERSLKDVSEITADETDRLLGD